MTLGKTIVLSFAIAIGAVYLTSRDSQNQSPTSPATAPKIDRTIRESDLPIGFDLHVEIAARKSDNIVRQIENILGSAIKDSDSGLLEIDSVYAGYPTNIVYRWMPFWNTDARTCAVYMNNEIQRLYSKTTQELDTINFTIEVPIDNRNGTHTWETRYHFTVTRANPNPNLSD